MLHLDRIMEKITKNPTETTIKDLIDLSKIIESIIEFYTDSECTDSFDTDYMIVSSGEIRFNIYFDISNTCKKIYSKELVEKIDKLFKGWVKTVPPCDQKDLEFRIDF